MKNRRENSKERESFDITAKAQELWGNDVTKCLAVLPKKQHATTTMTTALDR